jgi:hypothetical protein
VGTHLFKVCEERGLDVEMPGGKIREERLPLRGRFVLG